MQQVSSLIIELQNARSRLVKLFDAPDITNIEGTGYSPMFPWPAADRVAGAYSNVSDIRRDVI